jgi:hypothetical protein
VIHLQQMRLAIGVQNDIEAKQLHTRQIAGQSEHAGTAAGRA